jgi:hypothetical protein
LVDRRTINLSLFRITRNPLWFGKLQWVGPELIDDTSTGLLPPKAMPISYEDLDFMHWP